MGLNPGKRKLFTSLKEFFELCYWKYTRMTDKHLNNSHYKHFYTKYFSLTEEDYEDKIILDIGCGPRGSLEWADMAKERIGLDPLATKYLGMSGKNHKMTYIKGYAEDIPFPDNHFDMVTSFNSLDHVEDIKASCNEIIRVLKPGGLVLLAVDIHRKPTLTEPQTPKWNLVSKCFPKFSVLQEKHLAAKKKNRIYTNMRLNKSVASRKTPNGVLIAKLRKP